MKRSLLLFALLLVLTRFSFAQIQATTDSGHKVLLFEDGTWKYEGKQTVQTEKAFMETGLFSVATIQIDSSREVTTESVELFYLPSPALVRYFGEIRGKIRCKLSCSNIRGIVKLYFVWEIPVSDGFRYFGRFNEGTRVIFSMSDGQDVELLMSDENSFRSFEKSNYSILANSTKPLTQEQIALLAAHPVREIKVEWKKNTEEYDLNMSRYLMDTLPTVF